MQQSKIRVSIRQISDKSGFSASAVSLALRGSRKISEPTRREIVRVAAALGYQRDPQLSRALSFARSKDKPVFRQTLAFLSDYPHPLRTKTPWWMEGYFKGAQERATALGYALEHHILPRDAAGQKKLAKVLGARGIQGVVIAPVTRWLRPCLYFPWDSMSAVEIDQTIWRPRLPRVESEIFHALTHALRELKVRGYKRIGFALKKNSEMNRRWLPLATYLLFQRMPSRENSALEPMELGWKWDEPAFRAWITKEQPDVIVTEGEDVARWLQQEQIDVPGQIGILRLDCADNAKDSGLRPDYITMGMRAVDMVAGFLEIGDGGQTRIRSSVINPFWQEGTTVRRSKKSAKVVDHGSGKRAATSNAPR